MYKIFTTLDPYLEDITFASRAADTTDRRANFLSGIFWGFLEQWSNFASGAIGGKVWFYPDFYAKTRYRPIPCGCADCQLRSQRTWEAIMC
ncbi:hypothetical protein EYZ11_003314 [Aspergillus tanneri]|uniref:Uncharacterized protein n=1 Tax=Aspergillus tanneri TaxID=1220188 RepID=A0A4S3JNS2_9EURO|nr:hypothetical protein EYZ11_003314 [Aspergillus tanneri]